MQGQRSNPIAAWAPVTLLDLQRGSTPFVPGRSAPLQFCRSGFIAPRKTMSAARLSNFSHLFERQSASTRAIRAPASFPYSRRKSAPSMPTFTFPQQRQRRINIDRRKASPASPLCERHHHGNVRFFHCAVLWRPGFCGPMPVRPKSR